MIIKKFKQFKINESSIFGYDYNELVSNISKSGLVFNDPVETLDSKIEILNGILNDSNEIELYRLIFAKKSSDIDTENIGHHFVMDINDIRDDMIDYLYRNAKKKNKKLKFEDIFLIKCSTNPDNIDFSETILTFSLHPNEDEITIKDPKKLKILEIEKYYSE
jgi:hypothetical protein